MKNKKLFIVLVVIIIIAILLVLRFKKDLFVKKDDSLNQDSSLDQNSNLNQDKNFTEYTSTILGDGEPEKIIATVNGEEIKKKDINYKLLSNNYINEKTGTQYKKTDDESLKKEVISDTILLQEAKKK